MLCEFACGLVGWGLCHEGRHTLVDWGCSRNPPRPAPQGLGEKGLEAHGGQTKDNLIPPSRPLHAERLGAAAHAALSYSPTPRSELFDYSRCITYAVLTAVVALDRPGLKDKVVECPEVLAVIGAVPHLSPFLQSLYDCKYAGFFKVGGGAELVCF